MANWSIRNEVLHMAKEVRETKDINEAAALLQTDGWVCVMIDTDTGLFLLIRIS